MHKHISRVYKMPGNFLSTIRSCPEEGQEPQFPTELHERPLKIAGKWWVWVLCRFRILKENRNSCHGKKKRKKSQFFFCIDEKPSSKVQWLVVLAPSTKERRVGSTAATNQINHGSISKVSAVTLICDSDVLKNKTHSWGFFYTQMRVITKIN